MQQIRMKKDPLLELQKHFFTAKIFKILYKIIFRVNFDAT